MIIFTTEEDGIIWRGDDPDIDEETLAAAAEHAAQIWRKPIEVYRLTSIFYPASLYCPHCGRRAKEISSISYSCKSAGKCSHCGEFYVDYQRNLPAWLERLADAHE